MTDPSTKSARKSTPDSELRSRETCSRCGGVVGKLGRCVRCLEEAT